MLNSLFPIGKGWDWGTFILYVFVSIVVCALCKTGSKYKRECDYRQKHRGLRINKGEILYFFAFLILTCLATFRTSEVGSDTPVYVEWFYNYNIGVFSWKELLSFHQMEPGFQLYIFLIRKITDNYHVFFFFAYAFLSAMYIKYIKFFFDKDTDYLFLQIFIYFFVSNMSGMRAAIATGFLLQSFIYLSKKEYSRAIGFTILASAFHYTMIFNVAMIFATFIMERRSFWRKKWVLPVGLVASFIVSFAMSSVFKSILSNTKYDFYSSVSLDELSILGSIFYLFYAILAYCFYKDVSAEFSTKTKIENIFLLTISFLLSYPAIYVVAAYRIPNYYAMPRLTMWSEFATISERRYFKKNRFLFKAILQIVVILYLLFRFTRSAGDGNFAYIFDF